jgi:hypothetical protein
LLRDSRRASGDGTTQGGASVDDAGSLMSHRLMPGKCTNSFTAASYAWAAWGGRVHEPLDLRQHGGQQRWYSAAVSRRFC